MKNIKTFNRLLDTKKLLILTKYYDIVYDEHVIDIINANLYIKTTNVIFINNNYKYNIIIKPSLITSLLKILDKIELNTDNYIESSITLLKEYMRDQKRRESYLSDNIKILYDSMEYMYSRIKELEIEIKSLDIEDKIFIEKRESLINNY